MSPWNKWSKPWNMYTHILYTHPVFPMQPGAADALSPPSICYQRLQDPGSQRFADTFCLQPAADWQPGREVPREKRYNRKHFKSSDRLQDKKQDVYIWAIVSLFLHPFPFPFELFGVCCAETFLETDDISFSQNTCWDNTSDFNSFL